MQVITIVTAMKKQQWKWRGDHSFQPPLFSKHSRKMFILILRKGLLTALGGLYFMFLVEHVLTLIKQFKDKKKKVRKLYWLLTMHSYLFRAALGTLTVSRAFQGMWSSFVRRFSTFLLPEALWKSVTLDFLSSVFPSESQARVNIYINDQTRHWWWRWLSVCTYPKLFERNASMCSF